MKINTLKQGDVLHDVHTYKAGNTTMRVEGHWLVYVRDVDPEGKWADLSWNGNRAERYTEVPKGWKRYPKEWIRGGFINGGNRCGVCQAKETEGHTPSCSHPRAVAARKRATKETKQ